MSDEQIKPYEGFKGAPPCWYCKMLKRCSMHFLCSAMTELIRIRPKIDALDKIRNSANLTPDVLIILEELDEAMERQEKVISDAGLLTKTFNDALFEVKRDE